MARTGADQRAAAQSGAASAVRSDLLSEEAAGEGGRAEAEPEEDEGSDDQPLSTRAVAVARAKLQHRSSGSKRPSQDGGSHSPHGRNDSRSMPETPQSVKKSKGGRPRSARSEYGEIMAPDDPEFLTLTTFLSQNKTVQQVVVPVLMRIGGYDWRKSDHDRWRAALLIQEWEKEQCMFGMGAPQESEVQKCVQQARKAHTNCHKAHVKAFQNTLGALLEGNIASDKYKPVRELLRIPDGVDVFFNSGHPVAKSILVSAKDRNGEPVDKIFSDKGLPDYPTTDAEKALLELLGEFALRFVMCSVELKCECNRRRNHVATVRRQR